MFGIGIGIGISRGGQRRASADLESVAGGPSAWWRMDSGVTLDGATVASVAGYGDTIYTLEASDSKPAYEATGWNGTSPSVALLAASTQFLKSDAAAALFAGDDTPYTIIVAHERIAWTANPSLWSAGSSSSSTPYAWSYGYTPGSSVYHDRVLRSPGVFTLTRSDAQTILQRRVTCEVFSGTTLTMYENGGRTSILDAAMDGAAMAVDQFTLGPRRRVSVDSYPTIRYSEVAIWPKALSESEAKAAYDIMRARLGGLPTVDGVASVTIPDSLVLALGDIHTHSDTGRPADLFDAAIAVGLDYCALTDYGEAIDTDPTLWTDAAAAVAAKTSGTFVALRGLEFVAGAVHAGVIGSATNWYPYLTGATARADFFDAVAADAADLICVANHPTWAGAPWADTSYDADGAGRFLFCELQMHPAWADAVAKYAAFLDAGWRMGPAYDSDTHTLLPGAGDNRTSLFVASLTTANVLTAMRGYLSNGSNAAPGSWAFIAVNGVSMGGETPRSASATVQAHIHAAASGIETVEIYGSGGAVLDTQRACGGANVLYSKVLNLSAQAYVFAVITMRNGRHVVTSAVWLT